MKHILKAKEDVSQRIGELLLTVKKGDTQEFNPHNAEIAMSTGKFEAVEAEAETPFEETVIENDFDVAKALEDYPADFPNVEHYRSANLTYQQVQVMDEAALVALPGIGKAKAKETVQYLKENK